jgi:hypothetical protein
MIFDTGIYIDIEIGEFKNFLDIKDIVYLRIVETAGVILPTFQLSFRTTNLRIRDSIRENNPIKVKIGSSIDNYDTFTISIIDKKIDSLAVGYFNCYLYGFLGSKKLYVDKLIKAVNGTSLDCIKQVAEQFDMPVDTDIVSVYEEPQNWIISNQNNQKLLADAWYHMNIQPSFPLFAISRYGRIILKSLYNLREQQPKYIFTKEINVTKINQILYLNEFMPENNVQNYNLYEGYGKAVNIKNLNTGKYSVYANDNNTQLATTQQQEITLSGNRVFNSKFQSDNVHDNFQKCYAYNTGKLVQLSSIQGFVVYKGIYKRDLNLLDLVSLEPPQAKNLDGVYDYYSGKYVVCAIEYLLTATDPFCTKVYLSRDSLNHIENNLVLPNTAIQVKAADKQVILESAKELQKYISIINQLQGKSISSLLLDFLRNLKLQALNSFITSPTGFEILLISQQLNLQQIIQQTKNLVYKLLSGILPSQYMSLINTIENLILNRRNLLSNISLYSLFNNYISQVIPSDYITLFRTIFTTFNSLYVTLQSILNSVNTQIEISINTTSNTESFINITNITGNNSMLQSSSTQQDNVVLITNEILINTKGVDIPIPIIILTEAQNLFSKEQLKDYIINETISYLDSLGYLNNIDKDNFKDILYGNTVLDSNTIKTINNNVGSSLYIRHWGSFKDISELTDYYVRGSYKDKFKTVNMIKTIDCSGGKKVFLAYPTLKKDLAFYINNNKVEMETTNINLRYFDITNNLIDYTIYYYDYYFNSNSVTVEVRSE